MIQLKKNKIFFLLGFDLISYDSPEKLKERVWVSSTLLFRSHIPGPLHVHSHFKDFQLCLLSPQLDFILIFLETEKWMIWLPLYHWPHEARQQIKLSDCSGSQLQLEIWVPNAPSILLTAVSTTCSFPWSELMASFPRAAAVVTDLASQISHKLAKPSHHLRLQSRPGKMHYVQWRSRLRVPFWTIASHFAKLPSIAISWKPDSRVLYQLLK